MNLEVEDIAEEIAPEVFAGRTLFAIRVRALETRNGNDLRELFRMAGIVRAFRMGQNPAKWFGPTDEINNLRILAGVLDFDVEARKKELAEQAKKIAENSEGEK